MKEVFVADSPAQAHLVSGLLEEEGIRCIIDGEMLFGARGELGLTTSTLPRVCVNDEDAVRAIGVLRTHESARGETPPDPEDDPDAKRPTPRWKRLSVIAVLWTMIGAVSWGALGPFALPFVAVCLFIHVYLESGHDS